MTHSLLASSPSRLIRSDGATIAYHRSDGKAPGVMFLGGFMSDMSGVKATTLEAHCRQSGRAFVRFDYFGHGQSSGRFADGTISRWLEDAQAVLDEVASGPQLLVGSSMGGWLMLRLALARPARVHGLTGVAAAADFTEDLLYRQFNAPMRATLMRDGVIEIPSDYGDTPYPITRALIEDGRRHLVLGGPIEVHCPVHLLQGMMDRDVPWQTTLRIAERLESGSVVVTLIKDGDHRLSRPKDLARLTSAIDEMAAIV
jgi:pimeloyl-ACP methyl ester carboxylesterase